MQEGLHSHFFPCGLCFRDKTSTFPPAKLRYCAAVKADLWRKVRLHARTVREQCSLSFYLGLPVAAAMLTSNKKIKYTPIEEFVVPNSQNRNDIDDVIETFKVCRGVTTSANLSTNGIFYRDTK